MDVNITPVVKRPEGDRRPTLTDPVLVPMVAVAGALVFVLGLGIAVGWMAGRGWSSAPPAPAQPAPVVVERRCPAPEPAGVLAPAAARPPAGEPAPARLASEPPRPAKAAEPHPAARPPLVRIARAAGRSVLPADDGWEPARM
jgi:hypothetical protein